MADFAINVDWQSQVAQWIDAATTFKEGNDFFTAATSGASAWLNAPVDQVEHLAQQWSTGTRYFKMQGMDQLTAGVYATWVVTGYPDFAANRYVGGLNLPLRDVTMVDSWSS